MDCCSDGALCCFGYHLTPCLFGDNVDRLRGGGCCSPCLSYYCLSLFCLQGLVAGETRAALRNKYNLPQEPCDDCVVHCFCTPCAVCQEARELKRRGVSYYQPPASQFVTSAPPQQQMYPTV
ncbi:hypothetical protein WJX72_001590 [[Myrmecia] bisecta]|uniref:Uncharacterized protein n=1 Tax=[Myrmecia] bisecta TaxID=41462 RepID=A0AAW1R531_9CHLO